MLYDAGVDVHEADGLGGLKLTDEGLIRREALVLDTCVGMGVPVAAYVGAGTTEISTRSPGDTASCTTSLGKFFEIQPVVTEVRGRTKGGRLARGATCA